MNSESKARQLPREAEAVQTDELLCCLEHSPWCNVARKLSSLWFGENCRSTSLLTKATWSSIGPARNSAETPTDALATEQEGRTAREGVR